MDELLPPDQPTSALDALLVRWRENGDLEARNALFDDSQRRIQRIVRNQLNRFESLRDDAGEQTDAVRNLVLVNYWRWTESAEFTIPSTLREYFAGVAQVTRTTLLGLRHGSERPGRIVPNPDAGVVRATADTSSDHLIAEEHLDLEDQALERLRAQGCENEYIACILFRFAGRSRQEIADVLEIEYQTARRLVMRAQAMVGAEIRRLAHPDNFDNPTEQ